MFPRKISLKSRGKTWRTWSSSYPRKLRTWRQRSGCSKEREDTSTQWLLPTRRISRDWHSITIIIIIEFNMLGRSSKSYEQDGEKGEGAGCELELAIIENGGLVFCWQVLAFPLVPLFPGRKIGVVFVVCRLLGLFGLELLLLLLLLLLSCSFPCLLLFLGPPLLFLELLLLLLFLVVWVLLHVFIEFVGGLIEYFLLGQLFFDKFVSALLQGSHNIFGLLLKVFWSALQCLDSSLKVLVFLQIFLKLVFLCFDAGLDAWWLMAIEFLLEDLQVFLADIGFAELCDLRQLFLLSLELFVESDGWLLSFDDFKLVILFLLFLVLP